MVSKKQDSQTSASTEKIAILMGSLGPEISQKILKHLKDSEVLKVLDLTQKIKKVKVEDYRQTLLEFYEKLSEQDEVIFESNQNVSDLIDSDRREKILGKGSLVGKKGLEVLSMLNTDQLYLLIYNEHPQTISLILSFLTLIDLKNILLKFDDKLKAELVLRLSQLAPIPPENIDLLDQTLKEKLKHLGLKQTSIDGMKQASSLLAAISSQERKKLESKMLQLNAEQTKKLKESYLQFEDLVKLDQESFKKVFYAFDSKVWTVALKKESRSILEKIQKVSSKRAFEEFKENIRDLPPVRLSEVEKSQVQIIKLALTWLNEGKIFFVSDSDPLV